MAVSTFTMQDVVDGVLNMLRYAPGRDVQIHLQSSIVQDASMLYRTLMVQYKWRDFMTLTTVNIDSTTGEPVEDLTGVLDRFSNLLDVYKDKETQPLPFAPGLANPSTFNRSTVVPSGGPKIFSIWPHAGMTCHMWTRMFRDHDFELEDEIPFYKDILVLGTSYQLAVKSGVNQELTQQLMQLVENTINIYQVQGVKAQYQTNISAGSIPMEWYTYDN